MTDKSRVAYLTDFSARQVRIIEQAVGVPIDRWRSDAPKGLLYPHLVAAIEGTNPEDYDDVPLRELVAMIALEDEPAPKGKSAGK